MKQHHYYRYLIAIGLLASVLFGTLPCLLAKESTIQEEAMTVVCLTDHTTSVSKLRAPFNPYKKISTTSLSHNHKTEASTKSHSTSRSSLRSKKSNSPSPTIDETRTVMLFLATILSCLTGFFAFLTYNPIKINH